MNRDSLDTLVTQALILSLVSSFIGLVAGLLGQEETRKGVKEKLENEKKLRTELNEIHKEIKKLKAQICNDE